MKTTLRFIKLSNKWFVDIPWDGDIDDLQMVDGADLMLDALSHGNFYGKTECYGGQYSYNSCSDFIRHLLSVFE